MKKKAYIIPRVEVEMVNTVLMNLTGTGSLLGGPGSGGTGGAVAPSVPGVIID